VRWLALLPLALSCCATTSQVDAGLDECTFQICVRDRISSQEKEAIQLKRLEELAERMEEALKDMSAYLDTIKEWEYNASQKKPKIEEP
jgi:hypothetical protein